MTLAMERIDSEIHSFSHRAIMIRATYRTDSEIHSFSQSCNYHDPGHGEKRQ